MIRQPAGVFICLQVSRGESPQGTGGSAPHAAHPNLREV
jgi:hypothetical protein